MIRLLQHSEIDFVKWDSAIDAFPNGMVYAKSWYLDCVAPGWSALVEGDYSSIFPLTGRKKYGFRYLYQPFFAQQLGLFSKDPVTTDRVESFLRNIPEYYRLIEIHLNCSNTFSGKGIRVVERLTHHLDLGAAYENLRKGYSENLQRNLKRAMQYGLTITGDFNVSELVQLFRSNRGKEVATLADKDYLVFEKLCATASGHGLVTPVGIQMDGNLEAGAIFLRSNHEYIFLFSATGSQARASGAMALIIDHFIQRHAGEKMKLDFEGSMDPGLARFYKSFGSKEVVYLQLRKNNLPLPFRWLK